MINSMSLSKLPMRKYTLLIQSHALSVIVSMIFVMFYLVYYLYFSFLHLTLLSAI